MSAQSTLPPVVTAGPLAAQCRHVITADLITIGQSAAQVYRLVDRAGDVCFLKYCPHGTLFSLADEVARLRWLAGRLPVPAVLGYAEDERGSYLLMSAVSGVDAATAAETQRMDTAHLVRLLAEGLRRFHATPIVDCPFDHRLTAEVARAKARMEQGQVDEQEFDAERYGRSTQSLWAELINTVPATEAPVLTHGDYCLPNILLADGAVSGFIDLERCGVGDRYRDLALARRSLIRNCGAEWLDHFFTCYGLPEPDLEKLDFYQLLDEFY